MNPQSAFRNPQCRVFFYISGHGFGHASRDIELIRALIGAVAGGARHRPHVGAERLFAPLRGFDGVEVQRVETDTGVVQIDSLRSTKRTPRGGPRRFYATSTRASTREASVLTAARADLVVGDIPPLAFAAAARAGDPVGRARQLHLGLDLQHLPGVRAERARRDCHDPRAPTRSDVRAAPAVPRRLRADGGGDARYPVHRAAVEPRPRRRRAMRSSSPPGVPLVLASFGALRADLPVERLLHERPVHARRSAPRAAARLASTRIWSRPPTWSSASPATASSRSAWPTARRCSTPRAGDSPNTTSSSTEMPRFLRCRYISQEDLLAGRWADGVEALLAQAAPPETPASRRRRSRSRLPAAHPLRLSAERRRRRFAFTVTASGESMTSGRSFRVSAAIGAALIFFTAAESPRAAADARSS